MSHLVTGNYFDKYRSANPLHRWMTQAFISSAKRLLAGVPFKNVLEVGCGPGDLAWHLFGCQSGNVQYVGIDISKGEIDLAKSRYPSLGFVQGSAYEIPSGDRQYDLCVACEVLEHLEYPEVAVAEIGRVTAGYALVSVPWEPVWRMLNVSRGKYLSRLGNTPGHIQHFSRRSIRRLVEREFRIEKQLAPFPWTMLLLNKET